MNIPTLTTDRLRLRPFTEADIDPLHQMLSDPEVLRYMPVTDPPNRQWIERFVTHRIEHWTQHQFGWWAVEPLVLGELIGWSGLTHLPETGEDEVGYLLGKAHWGQGYATEAARACVQFGFEQVGLKQIIALTHPQNTASQNVVKKLGLSFVDQVHYFGMDCYRYMIEAPMAYPS